MAAVEWRDTLGTLLPQFEARAARSPGLHHLLVEVADDEREKMTGPPWFEPFATKVRLVDGKPVYGQWDASAFRGLPGISPGFREPNVGESFDEPDSRRAIRDQSGVVRAVAVPLKLRQGYFCGAGSEELPGFESLANAAATALASSKDLHEHAFASDLVDLFRKPRGGIRYVFGEVPAAPEHFIARGWSAGVLQFKHGVLIDVPISESAPDASHWLLLLHRLGWRHIEGSGLRAVRHCWDGNVEASLELLGEQSHVHGDPLSERFAKISRDSFYSVLGTKDAPLDVSLASVFAIQLLLAELSVGSPDERAESEEDEVDYSEAEWHLRKAHPIRTVAYEECTSLCAPRIGIAVATEVERQAVLKRLRPPKRRRAVLQVYCGKNTCYVGRLGIADIVLYMVASGSIGRDASLIVTAEIIESWRLAAVIMVGIAFGKDSAKQNIGNVLVSDRVIPYEPERIGEASRENRGIEISAGTVLLNRFRNILGWKFQAPNGRACGFQAGPLLSGEKLVDNLEFRSSLFKRYPTAIGGEMEGAGVAAAAARKGCEWILVKAICDWGDGRKTKVHQGFAAAASVSLTEHLLNQAGALNALT